MAQKPSPEDLAGLEWEMPRGGVTMALNPGDAVVWSESSWHGGWPREVPGVRMNLAAYFCNPMPSTQELRGDTRYPEVFERYKNNPLFARLFGANIYNGCGAASTQRDQCRCA